MTSDQEVRELLNVALVASKAAEKVILSYFETSLSIEWKEDNTPVTIADKGAEEAIRKVFAKETPEFGIVGEEFGAEGESAEYKWVIDPIDGTKAFMRGVPLFGTLIGLHHKDVSLVGIIGLPALHHTLFAGKGLGAMVDGQRVHVSNVDKLNSGLALSGTINTFDHCGYSLNFEAYRKSALMYRGWGDCYGYYLVATGRAEAMVDPTVSLWDVAAFPCILNEAGGKFSTLSGEIELFNAAGEPLHAIHEGYTGMATNGLVHSEVLAHFKK
ncbi:MAG: histidinol-phosphatase [Fibrobacteraceae bacterium]|nr:histidinol-phosphatase [Fibrobacteraceae bacterium]